MPAPSPGHPAELIPDPDTIRAALHRMTEEAGFLRKLLRLSLSRAARCGAGAEQHRQAEAIRAGADRGRNQEQPAGRRA